MNPPNKDPDTTSSESQTRLLQTRIDSLEKQLFEIHNTIALYVNKIAKTRDEADVLAANLLTFAQTEHINLSLRHGLSNFANCLNAIQDFRDDEVKKLEEKVINKLSTYGEITRKAKEELKTNSNARSKQLSELKVGKMQELMRSSSFNEVSNVFKVYEMQIQRFEMKKICDIKKTFLEFTKTELLFHAKTIEVLSEAFKHILSIDEDKDFNDFCTHFGFSQTSGSPKRDDSTKTSEEDKIEVIPTLRRFNSAPDFNSSIDTNISFNNELNRESKSVEAIDERVESNRDLDLKQNYKI